MSREKFNEELFLKAYMYAFNKSPLSGLRHFRSVPITEVFFKYLQLDKHVKVEDFFEFTKWVWLKPYVEKHPGWNIIHSMERVNDWLSAHRENVTCGIEQPSEKGFWKMLRTLAKIPKNDYTFGEFLISLKAKPNT